jgi:hypothetical protein
VTRASIAAHLRSSGYASAGGASDFSLVLNRDARTAARDSGRTSAMQPMRMPCRASSVSGGTMATTGAASVMAIAPAMSRGTTICVAHPDGDADHADGDADAAMTEVPTGAAIVSEAGSRDAATAGLIDVTGQL